MSAVYFLVRVKHFVDLRAQLEKWDLRRHNEECTNESKKRDEPQLTRRQFVEA